MGQAQTPKTIQEGPTQQVKNQRAKQNKKNTTASGPKLSRASRQLHVKDTCEPKTNKGTRVTQPAIVTERDQTRG